jgi:hypothetical protein
MASDETPCYSLEASSPALNYAVRAKPTAKQYAMCRAAVELHTRIDNLSEVDEARKERELGLVVNAFSVGGVQKNCDIQTAMDQVNIPRQSRGP